MSRHALVATTLAAGLVLAPATAATASPGNADGRTKALLQENEEYQENQRVPAWQRIPDCCEVAQPWGYADAILAITFTVGLVVLW